MEITKEQFEKEVEKRQRAEAEAVDLQKKVEAFSKFGTTEEIQAKFQELQSLKNKPSGDIDFDKKLEEALSSARAESANKIAELEDKVNKANGELLEIKIVGKAWEQIGNNFTPDAYKLLKAELKNNLMLDEAGNLLVKGKDGKPKYKEGTTLMGVTDFAETLKTEFPSLVKDPTIKGTMKGGASSNSSSNGAKGIDPAKLEALKGNKAEAIKYFSELANSR